MRKGFGCWYMQRWSVGEVGIDRRREPGVSREGVVGLEWFGWEGRSAGTCEQGFGVGMSVQGALW